MQPVRVKLYGLFPFTRTGYLREAVLEALMLFGVVCFWVLGWPDYRKVLVAMEPRPLVTARMIAFFDAIPYILAAAVLAKVLEMVLVLRAFARKEKAARQVVPPPPSAPVASAEQVLVSEGAAPPAPAVSADNG